jgi:hypothetical protein
MTTLSDLTGPLHPSLPARCYRYCIVDSLRILRQSGLRGLLRERGWRFVAGVIAYYLVRDTLLYVVLPLCVARGLFGK